MENAPTSFGKVAQNRLAGAVLTHQEVVFALDLHCFLQRRNTRYDSTCIWKLEGFRHLFDIACSKNTPHLKWIQDYLMQGCTNCC